MNRLESVKSRNTGPILATVTLAWLLSACSWERHYGINNDNSPQETTTSISEVSQPTLEVTQPIQHPEVIEWQVYIDFNINNATLALVDEETERTIPWFSAINTDYEWRAYFDLSTLQSQLQNLWDKRLFIIPTWIEPDYSSSIDLTNGAQHIITDFSNGIGKILRSSDIYNAVNDEIDHSAQSLTYFQTAREWYPQEVGYDLHRFNNAVSEVFWGYRVDINRDNKTNYFDINENPTFSWYADDCLVVNEDWSLSVNFIHPDDLYSRF